MNSCLYINKHLHMLNDVRKDAYNFYTYRQKPICVVCKSNKNVFNIVKYPKSKTLSDVSNITGNIFINPSNYNRTINKNFYCKKCDKFF